MIVGCQRSTDEQGLTFTIKHLLCEGYSIQEVRNALELLFWNDAGNSLNSGDEVRNG